MSPIIRWDPALEPFEQMEKFLSGQLNPLTRGFIPAVDVYETKNSVVVETPLPGIDPAKVDISIENDVLIIKGETEKKTEVEDKNYYRREIKSGGFYRSIALPTHVVSDKASAISEGGILKVTIPKAPEQKTKAIKVKVVSPKK